MDEKPSYEADLCPAVEGEGTCRTPRPCPVHMPFQWAAHERERERRKDR